MATELEPRLIVVSGCFLFFHDGHRRILSKAASFLRDQDHFKVLVNTKQYVVDKKLDALVELEKRYDAEGRAELQRQLTAQYRRSSVTGYLLSLSWNKVLPQEKIIVEICDDFFVAYPRPLMPVCWVVGDDYKDLDFKEASQADEIIIIPRKDRGREFLSTTDQLAQISFRTHERTFPDD